MIRAFGRRLARSRAALLAVGVAISAVTFGAIITAGGRDSHAASQRLAHALRSARRFRGFPLYWDGVKFGELPLTGVDVESDHDGIGYTFSYGTCTGGEEGGCAPPLEVQVTPLCNRLPRQLGLRVTRLRLRSAPTSAAETGSDNGGDLSIYTRGATITLFGYTRKLDLQAAAALRGLNPPAHAIDPADPLPAPPRRILAHGCSAQHPRVDADTLIDVDGVIGGIHAGESRSQVERLLGAGDAASTTTRHPKTGTYTLTRVAYPASALDVLYVHASHRKPLVFGVFTSSRRYHTASGLRVGSSLAQAQHTPGIRCYNQVNYDACQGGLGYERPIVSFTVRNGRVVRVFMTAAAD